MPLTIDDPHIERLARELAETTGEPLPHAVAAALRERLERLRAAQPGSGGDDLAKHAAEIPADGSRLQLRSIAEIQAYVASLPELDPRSPDEVLGYDALGLPG
ncbi:MAG TPA: type II toxin-antitoxin system VapB family antitoxin [Gemmatimonadaceae bacterium]|nr:type II toxin-antitoxin system VapB family antitoxin [Gemmatimonadaceae bacterium]